MSNQNKLEEIIRASLENIRSMVDANTVIGSPIATESGVTIIPISKVSVGYASGGIDFNGKSKSPADPQNFGAGGGTGVSVSPVGFLVVKSNGTVDMINVGKSAPQSNDPVEQIVSLLERCPDIARRVKSVFKKKTSEKNLDLEIITDNIEEEAAKEAESSK